MKVMRTLALFLAASAAKAENTTNTSSLEENMQDRCRFVGDDDTCQGQSPEAAFFGDSPLQHGVGNQYSYYTLQRGTPCVITCKNDTTTSCVEFQIAKNADDPRHSGYFSRLPPRSTEKGPGYNTDDEEGVSFVLCLPGKSRN